MDIQTLTNMGRSVFYKEQIKTKSMMLALLVFNMCVMAWNFISIRKLFAMDHSEVVWYRVMNLGQIPYQDLIYMPLISAIIFCLYQFLQEMRDARIRISLHLPCDSSVIVLLHGLYGLAFLSALFIVDMFVLNMNMQTFFPRETCQTALATSFPWFLAGIFAYLGGTFVLLEPQIKRKALGVIITFIICLELLLFKGASYYSNIIGIYLILLPLMIYAIPVFADDYRNRWS